MKQKKKKKQASGGGFGAAFVRGDWGDASELRSWLEDNGGRVEGTSVGYTNGMRGLVAARAFKAGDVVFRVPRARCIIDEARADASIVGRTVWMGSSGKTIASCIRVALLLYWLGKQADDESFNACLNTLPTLADFEAEGGPLVLWSQQELLETGCGQLVGEVGRRNADLERIYETVVQKNWDAALLDNVPCPTLPELTLAVVWATSRCFGFEDAVGGSSMLVPGVDLMNHAGLRAVAAFNLEKESDDDYFVVRASQGIRAGQEITISYGDFPPRLLLQQFGFLAGGGGLDDAAFLRLDGLLAAGWSPEGARLLDENPNKSSLFGSPKFRADPDSTAAASRWQPTGDDTRVACEAFEGNAGIVPGAQNYANLLREELAAFGTTEAEDDELLAASASSSRLKLAVRLRQHNRKLLTSEVSRLATMPKYSSTDDASSSEK